MKRTSAGRQVAWKCIRRPYSWCWHQWINTLLQHKRSDVAHKQIYEVHNGRIFANNLSWRVSSFDELNQIRFMITSSILMHYMIYAELPITAGHNSIFFLHLDCISGMGAVQVPHQKIHYETAWTTIFVKLRIYRWCFWTKCLYQKCKHHAVITLLPMWGHNHYELFAELVGNIAQEIGKVPVWSSLIKISSRWWRLSLWAGPRPSQRQSLTRNICNWVTLSMTYFHEICGKANL